MSFVLTSVSLLCSGLVIYVIYYLYYYHIINNIIKHVNAKFYIEVRHCQLALRQNHRRQTTFF